MAKEKLYLLRGIRDKEYGRKINAFVG